MTHALFLSLRRAVLHPSLVLTADDDDVTPQGDGSVDINAMIRRFTSGNNADGEKNENSQSSGNTYAENVLTNLSQDDPEADECPICFDIMERPMVFPRCMHKWYAQHAT